jgi:hypothetical protein
VRAQLVLRAVGDTVPIGITLCAVVALRRRRVQPDQALSAVAETVRVVVTDVGLIRGDSAADRPDVQAEWRCLGHRHRGHPLPTRHALEFTVFAGANSSDAPQSGSPAATQVHDVAESRDTRTPWQAAADWLWPVAT